MLNQLCLFRKRVTSLGLLFCCVALCALAPFTVSAAESPVETPTDVPTAIPPTEVPPTVAPETPTEIPPTVVPPTAAPETPTEVPPTEVPPTEVPPTVAPETPTEVPPTEVPPTEIPPTETATEVPVPTEVPPTEVPPTETPETPTEIPPTEVPPTETPETPTEVPPTAAPTPVMTPTPSGPGPDQYPNPKQGITILDGFGGVHEIGDILGFYDRNGNGILDDPSTTAWIRYFEGQDIYCDLEVYIENEGTEDARIKAALAITGDGLISSALFEQTVSGVQVTTNYLMPLGIDFSTPDTVRDVEFHADGQGYYTLLSDGSILSASMKSESVLLPVLVQSKLTNPRLDPAVDLEIVESGDTFSAYVLTAKGRIFAIGDATPLIGNAISNIPIYKDMELYGSGAVIADGYGRFTTVTPDGSELDIPLFQLDFGFDALVDFEIQVDPEYGVGIISLTNVGTLHTSGAIDFFLTAEGAARRDDLDIITTEDGVSFATLNINFDILRDLEVWLLQ